MCLVTIYQHKTEITLIDRHMIHIYVELLQRAGQEFGTLRSIRIIIEAVFGGKLRAGLFSS